MSNGTWSKVTARSAQEVCKLCSLSDEGKPLLRDGQTPKQLVDLLIEKKHFLDAIRVLAAALPKRESVWWACQCARQAHGSNLTGKVSVALQAAEKWAADPSEDNRRAAGPAAEAAELSTPGGCAAMAAFWSGGSLAPPNVPVVPPADNLTPHAVAGAVMLSAVLNHPEKAEEKHKAFLGLGSEIAAGTRRWK